MIPLRVSLKNFLCHAEAVFDFENSPLWLLHGPNGVGKSAVFDAMLYALFGEHKRREKSDSEISDLIRHGERSLRVDFDFEYHGRRYRIWRTRTRSGQPKQGVSAFEGDELVPNRDVNSVRDLDQWVLGTLGLSYDAFVSAVLLRQGAAERLIDADKNARRDLFRGIIDLEPFIRLHKCVTDARTKANAEARVLKDQLQGKPEVTDAEMMSAADAVADAAGKLTASHEAEQIARERGEQARIWEGLNKKKKELENALTAAAVRLAHSEQLQRDVERLKYLREAVPAIQKANDARTKLTGATLACEELNSRREDQLHRRDVLTAKADNAKADAAKVAASIRELDQQIQEAKAKHERCGQQVEQARKAEELHNQLAAKRSAMEKVHADLDAHRTAAIQSAVECQAAKDAAPYLAVLAQQRTNYHQTREAHRSAAEAECKLAASLTELRASEAAAIHEERTAADALLEVKQAVAVADSKLASLKDRLSRFLTQAGAIQCSECGQEIDATHAERERVKFERLIVDAEATLIQAERDVRTQNKTASEAKKNRQGLEQQRQQAEANQQAASRQREESERESVKARKAFDAALHELHAAYAWRVASLEREGYPTITDAAAAKAEAGKLAAALKARDTLATECQIRDGLSSSIALLEKTVAAFGAPQDTAVATAELAALAASLGKLISEREASEINRRIAESTESSARASLATLQNEIAKLAGEIGSAESALSHAAAALAQALAALPPSATEQDDVAVMLAERSRLEAVKVEEQFAALADDRALDAERKRQLSEFDQQIAAIPAEARRPAVELQSELATASAISAAAQWSLHETQRIHGDLQRRRTERIEHYAKLATAEENASLHDRLADLLGPEGIQLDLLRSAENRIIGLANDVLVRVSNGELRFEPPDPAGDRALDLSVRRFGSEPISVANLSGGQRCRVAVSLALAVCQYACGQAKPLESIIIDEAFAQLDRDGRSEMIKVLRDGSLGLLKRIIVVSHHEDVVGAFPVGYKLESTNGATTVERFG